jgi:hypothetical protein
MEEPARDTPGDRLRGVRRRDAAAEEEEATTPPPAPVDPPPPTRPKVPDPDRRTLAEDPPALPRLCDRRRAEGPLAPLAPSPPPPPPRGTITAATKMRPSGVSDRERPRRGWMSLPSPPPPHPRRCA